MPSYAPGATSMSFAANNCRSLVVAFMARSNSSWVSTWQVSRRRTDDRLGGRLGRIAVQRERFQRFAASPGSEQADREGNDPHAAGNQRKRSGPTRLRKRKRYQEPTEDTGDPPFRVDHGHGPRTHAG